MKRCCRGSRENVDSSSGIGEDEDALPGGGLLLIDERIELTTPHDGRSALARPAGHESPFDGSAVAVLLGSRDGAACQYRCVSRAVRGRALTGCGECGEVVRCTQDPPCASDERRTSVIGGCCGFEELHGTASAERLDRHGERCDGHRTQYVRPHVCQAHSVARFVELHLPCQECGGRARVLGVRAPGSAGGRRRLEASHIKLPIEGFHVHSPRRESERLFGHGRVSHSRTGHCRSEAA